MHTCMRVKRISGDERGGGNEKIYKRRGKNSIEGKEKERNKIIPRPSGLKG